MNFIKSNLWKVLTLVLVVSLSLTRTIYISEPDILWQTRTGIDVLNGESLLHPDNYSWAMEGQEYLPNSWLWNITLALVYQSLGLLGIAFFTGLIVLLILGGIVYFLRQKSVTWFAIFFTIALVGVTCNAWFSGRPQVIDYLLLVAVMIIFHHLEIKTWKSHVLVFVLMGFIVILWNNFHLTGLVGALLITALYFLKQSENIPFTLALLKPLFSSALLGVFLFLACLITPYGVDGVLKPFITSSASQGVVNEWLSPWLFQDSLHIVSVIAILLILPVTVGLWKRKEYYNLFFIVSLLVISSIQVRWTPFLVIVSLFWLARAIENLKSRVPSKHAIYIKVIAGAILLPVVSLGLYTFIPQNRVSAADYGFDLVSEIPVGCKLFNNPSTGGAVILMRPDIKVSVDGRNDFYGEKYIEQNRISYGLDNSLQWLDNNQITCVLLEKEYSLLELLRNETSWKLQGTDKSGVELWVKKT